MTERPEADFGDIWPSEADGDRWVLNDGDPDIPVPNDERIVSPSDDDYEMGGEV